MTTIKNISVCAPLLLLPFFSFSGTEPDKVKGGNKLYEPIISELSYQLAPKIDHISLKFEHSNVKIIHQESDEIDIIHRQQLINGDAESCLYQITKDQSNTKLTLKNEKVSTWSSLFSDCKIRQSIELYLTKQQIESLELNISHGHLKLDTVAANYFELNAQHAKALLADINVKEFELNLQHSAFVAESLHSNNIDISGGHSKLTFLDIESGLLEADLSHSPISFEKSEISSLTVDNSHGGIVLKEHQGKILSLATSHNKIIARTQTSEQARLENSHGVINYSGMAKSTELHNSHGLISAEQLGDKVFFITADNSHGNVLLTVPKGSQYITNADQSQKKENISFVELKSAYGSTEIKEAE